MKALKRPCYYGDYLQLNKLLDSQHPESKRFDNEAHDETLFIIVHQAYELWFKQILHEIHHLMKVFEQPSVDEASLGSASRLLERVLTIQDVLIKQLDIMETMTPLDFLDFRDYLVPASGFQSIQFKEIEILLGLKAENRINFDRQSFYQRLNDKDRDFLTRLEDEPSLFDHINTWLARMPFSKHNDFDFWQAYHQSVTEMLDSDRAIISENETITEDEKKFQLADLDKTQESFACLIDSKKYEEQKKAGNFRFDQKAMLAAVFINLYRDQPILAQPFRLLTNLVKIDESFTNWRHRHALMVHRIIGRKIGTGGSSGHGYLKQTTENNRFFSDLFNLSTFLLPRSARPQLPQTLVDDLGFLFKPSQQ